MGYTHYWTFGPFIEEKAYKTALTECRKIIKASPVPLGNWEGKGNPNLQNGFNCNGVGNDGHETFRMGKEPIRDEWFCKTAQKPYDVVVTACLCVMHDHLGSACEVTSDGDPHEWEAGMNLASKVLGRTIRIPYNVINQTRMYGWAAEAYRKEHPEYDYTPLDETHPNRHSERKPNWVK